MLEDIIKSKFSSRLVFRQYIWKLTDESESLFKKITESDIEYIYIIPTDTLYIASRSIHHFDLMIEGNEDQFKNIGTSTIYGIIHNIPNCTLGALTSKGKKKQILIGESAHLISHLPYEVEKIKLAPLIKELEDFTKLDDKEKKTVYDKILVKIQDMVEQYQGGILEENVNGISQIIILFSEISTEIVKQQRKELEEAPTYYFVNGNKITSEELEKLPKEIQQKVKKSRKKIQDKILNGIELRHRQIIIELMKIKNEME